MKRVFDNVKMVQSLVPAVRTADANGVGVDTQGYEQAVLLVPAGAIDTGDADETYVIELEESDDNSSWSDVADHDVTITADDETDMVRIKNLNVTRKRYLRAVLNVGGTSPSFAGGAIFLLEGGPSGPENVG